MQFQVPLSKLRNTGCPLLQFALLYIISKQPILPLLFFGCGSPTFPRENNPSPNSLKAPVYSSTLALRPAQTIGLNIWHECEKYILVQIMPIPQQEFQRFFNDIISCKRNHCKKYRMEYNLILTPSLGDERINIFRLLNYLVDSFIIKTNTHSNPWLGF